MADRESIGGRAGAPAGRVALLGHGRFGAALAALAEEAGLEVAALDPCAAVPPRRRARSLDALLEGAGIVIPAVPVDAFATVLERVSPLLGPEQTVVDVASVKHGPILAMQRTLGARVPWVATHPLFGPSSIALGERPLRVVVCPNAAHPAAERTAHRFWERVGCEVQVQEADAHDRLMADTHALAFFVAKGLMDSGLDPAPAFAPPSFRAMARTVEAVRSDAGHLFATIQAANPYAAASRARLLDALNRIHRLLAEAPRPAGVPPGSPELTIPDLGDRAPDHRRVPELLDDCDREIVRLLARRAQLARRREPRTAEPDGAPRAAAWLEPARRLGLDAGAVGRVFAAVRELARPAGRRGRQPRPR